MAAYERTNWENAPSKTTPVNADNLNNMEDGIEAANTDVEQLKATVKTVKDNYDLVNARMDTIVAVPAGSTTDNAELLDIRVGDDGVTYTSAGKAVRDQLHAVKTQLESIDDLEEAIETLEGSVGNLDGAVTVLETKAQKTQSMIAQPFNEYGVYPKDSLIVFNDKLYKAKHDVDYSESESVSEDPDITPTNFDPNDWDEADVGSELAQLEGTSAITANNIAPEYQDIEYQAGELRIHDGQLYEANKSRTTWGGGFTSADWDATKISYVNGKTNAMMAPAYVRIGTYSVGDYCYYGGKLYRCIENTSGTWNASKWEEVTVASELNAIDAQIEDLKSGIDVSVTAIEDVDYHMLLNDTYTGTTLITIDVSIPSGTYVIDVDNIESSDTDSTNCNLSFTYVTSGAAFQLIGRGSNVQNRITLENDVKQITFYASDSYGHSLNDTFTFTGFKMLKQYQLMVDVETSRDTRNTVKSMIEDMSVYDTGERTVSASTLTYKGSDGKIVSGSLAGYSTYEYTIDRPTSFKVTGKTKGASNYLALGADNDGNVLQALNQGQSGTETQYTDHTFMIDTPRVTKVYICLYDSESDNVQIGILSGTGAGVSDYDELANRPQINGVTITGDKTSSDLGLAGEQEVSKIRNLQEDVIFSGSYSGTTLTSVSVNIPAGTYVLDIARVTSADTDDTTSFVNFIYTGSGALGVNISRGNNIRKKIVLEKDVTTIYLYAANGYAHSNGDSFSFTGFKVVTSYPLAMQLDEIKESLDELTGSSATWDNGERTFSDSTFTYADSSGHITSGTLSGYATYIYNISGKAKFKVTGNTRGADNYLALGATDDGTVVQRVEKGTAGVSTPYTDFEFTINDPSATKVYICLYKSASDDVKIEVVQNNDELSILFVGNSLTQDGIAYVPYMLRTFYPEVKFRFYMWYNGGYTLAQQYEKFTADTACEAFSVAENVVSWTTSTAKMSDILSKYRFNIVCMQEYFNRKTTYVDADLTDWNNCRNYIVSHYGGSNGLEFISLFHSPWLTDEQTVYDLTKTGNALILKKTLSDDMIATGMALHMARSTDLDSLGDQGHLTPDTIHAQEGLPCLLEAYTALLWVLDRLDINKSIYGLPFKMTATIQARINVPGANLGTGVIEGTDAQNILAQEVAIMAYKAGKKFVADNLAE